MLQDDYKEVGLRCEHTVNAGISTISKKTSDIPTPVGRLKSHAKNLTTVGKCRCQRIYHGVSTKRLCYLLEICLWLQF